MTKIIVVILYMITAMLITIELNNVNGAPQIRDILYCPPQELILPCRCSQKAEEIQVWCSHSDLPRIIKGIKSIAKTIQRPIDELILENNQLPSLPGRFFAPLQVMRLMLRHNGLERLTNGWLKDLETNLVEIFIVERDLRSVPIDSLTELRKLEAITIQSDSLKRTPDFSGLINLRYINIQSNSLIELSPKSFQGLPSLETVHITGGSERLNRLESGLFQDLPRLQLINLSGNGINWIHLRAVSRLASLTTIELSDNKITDAGMIGRAVKDLNRLEILKLDHNEIAILGEGSFVALPSLMELHLNDNRITEIHYGAFHRIPKLKLVHLENNRLNRVHPESFLQASGSGVELLHLQQNEINRIEELRSLLDTLPMLKFLDLSNNKLEEIPFGALHGHGTIEQLHLDNNHLRHIARDAFMAMPALRELRLRNNTLNDMLPLPFWNLPGLKGLDLSANEFRNIEEPLLMGLPSLRRLDISDNYLTRLEPTSFLHTPYLETINMSNNEIIEIHPAAFRNLDRLFEIDASFNNLQEFIPGLPKIVERLSLKNNQIQTLSAAIQNQALNLPNLRMLDLGYNNLDRIPRAIFNELSQLRYLSLAKNHLQQIDDQSLMGMVRLERLNMQDNQLNALSERTFDTLQDLRNLNIQGNRLELLNENVFGGTPRLEHLDISRNNIMEMSSSAFRNCRMLRSIDLSSNNLKELPQSLSGLSDLKLIDISYNNLINLSPEILSSWRHLEELRASNNKIVELPHGTFRNLPILEYLDLSSNELQKMHVGAIKNLPELQELVLADNRIVEIGDRVFEELPNLQAVHLQQNNLRYMSPQSFYRSPSIVYLNLSSNHFDNLEHVGLRSVRNLEVLDLSNNGIKRITTNPLRDLDWLVELKLDDNRICKVQGEPFTSMPRLRVLTMRNNRMMTVSEPTFRSLRGNLAILDLDGNPLDCSCNMLWLQGWLQETGSLTNYPGPRCRDGSMLRESRLSRTDCSTTSGQQQQQQQSNQIPLTNEHGDTFFRQISDGGLINSNTNNECADESFDEYSNNIPPSPIESEYFYNQYVDYPTINETHLYGTTNNSLYPPSMIDDDPQQQNNERNSFNASNTILNYNQIKQQQHQMNSGGPAFTFFGLPLPNLNMGNLWSNNIGKDAKTRSAAVSATSSGSITPVMGSSRGKGRVQIYRPDDPEIFKFIHRNDQNILDRNLNPLYDHLNIQNNNNNMNNNNNNEQMISNNQHQLDNDNNGLYHRPYFQTPFAQPNNIEKGGFKPILPGEMGGFRPIHNPYLIQNLTNDKIQTNASESHFSASSSPIPESINEPEKQWPNDNYSEVVPLLITESSTAEMPEKVLPGQYSINRGPSISFNNRTNSSNKTNNRIIHPLLVKPLENDNTIHDSKSTTTVIETTEGNNNYYDIASSSTSASASSSSSSSPLQNYLADLSGSSGGGDRNRHEFTTKSIVDKFHENKRNPNLKTIEQNQPNLSMDENYQFNNHKLDNSMVTTIREQQKQSTTTETFTASTLKFATDTPSWDHLNHSSSSLSELVAPGAQQGIYRSPPGRSTITKIYTTPQPSSLMLPIAEEYLRTTSDMRNNRNLLNTDDHNTQSYYESTTPPQIAITTSSSSSPSSAINNEFPKKKNIDWYYENYNKSNLNDFDPTINRLKSSNSNNSSEKLQIKTALITVTMSIIINLCF